MNLNDHLPENLRLGTGDLRQVGLEFCFFVMNEEIVTEAQFEIPRAALSTAEGRPHLLGASGPPDWLILAQMGLVKMEIGDYDAAKDLLLRAKSRTPVRRPKISAYPITDLIVIYVKQQDRDSLQWVYKDLLEGFAFLHEFEYSQDLDPREWISLLHETLCSFRPHYDLSAPALTDFLDLLDRQLPVEESEKLGMIRLIAEYYLGLIYFGAAQFQEAQNSFLSLLGKTAELTYSDSVLFLEVSSRFY
jgi:tetratricopeptide (TPR) repeat protein